MGGGPKRSKAALRIKSFGLVARGGEALPYKEKVVEVRKPSATFFLFAGKSRGFFPLTKVDVEVR